MIEINLDEKHPDEFRMVNPELLLNDSWHNAFAKSKITFNKNIMLIKNNKKKIVRARIEISMYPEEADEFFEKTINKIKDRQDRMRSKAK